MSDKKKFELEFIVKSSSKILYGCIATPSGLSEWFSDDVNIRDDIYTFFWDGTEEQAKLLSKKNQEFIKFQWLEDIEAGNSVYFELRIKIDAMTKGVAIIVTDFAEEDEIEESSLLWGSQIDQLRRIVGG
jgi:hypothetical protein